MDLAYSVKQEVFAIELELLCNVSNIEVTSLLGSSLSDNIRAQQNFLKSLESFDFVLFVYLFITPTDYGIATNLTIAFLKLLMPAASSI